MYTPSPEPAPPAEFTQSVNSLAHPRSGTPPGADTRFGIIRGESL